MKTERHAVAVSAEGTRAALSAARVQDIVRGVLRAERVGPAMVSVTFLSSRAMAALNRRHLGHRGATDVISFGFAPSGGQGIVGDIYVCPDVARENAAHFGCGVREETARLVIHGTLHVLGYDHPVNAAREASPMWARQERLLRRLAPAPAL
ncbi:MAG: rRNA maturation RNase YbeY [Gemmatimonadaceae bacterium]|nr:rRNA maturation RNase YbeY [Gemmatimonadaceae bacterium]